MVSLGERSILVYNLQRYVSLRRRIELYITTVWDMFCVVLHKRIGCWRGREEKGERESNLDGYSGLEFSTVPLSTISKMRFSPTQPLFPIPKWKRGGRLGLSRVCQKVGKAAVRMYVWRDISTVYIYTDISMDRRICSLWGVRRKVVSLFLIFFLSFLFLSRLPFGLSLVHVECVWRLSRISQKTNQV